MNGNFFARIAFASAFSICSLGLNATAQEKPIPPLPRSAPDLEKLGPGFAFEITATNHFYVEVKLNNKGPFRLIFDLGAPVTLLSNRAAKESKASNASKGSRSLLGMGGEGQVKEMQFGQSVAKDIPVMIFDHPAITAMSQILGIQFDGILGYTFFARYRTTIDYQKKRLWFEPVRESTDNIVTALPETLLNPAAKKPAREVISRTSAIGLKVAVQLPENNSSTPPVLAISEIRTNSPAEKAGLQPGDILVSLGPHWLFSPADLADALSGDQETPMTLMFMRNNMLMKVQITPEQFY